MGIARRWGRRQLTFHEKSIYHLHVTCEFSFSFIFSCISPLRPFRHPASLPSSYDIRRSPSPSHLPFSPSLTPRRSCTLPDRLYPPSLPPFLRGDLPPPSLRGNLVLSPSISHFSLPRRCSIKRFFVTGGRYSHYSSALSPPPPPPPPPL